jgi:hypothetical protein
MKWTSNGAILGIARAGSSPRSERVSKDRNFSSAILPSSAFVVSFVHRRDTTLLDLSLHRTFRIPVAISPRGLLVRHLVGLVRRGTTTLSVVANFNRSATTTTTTTTLLRSQYRCDIQLRKGEYSMRSIDFSGVKGS